MTLIRAEKYVFFKGDRAFLYASCSPFCSSESSGSPFVSGASGVPYAQQGLLKPSLIDCSRTAARFSRVRHHDTHDAADGGGREEISGVQQRVERHQSRRLGVRHGGGHVLRGFRQLVRAQWFPTLRLERGEYSVCIQEERA